MDKINLPTTRYGFCRSGSPVEYFPSAVAVTREWVGWGYKLPKQACARMKAGEILAEGEAKMFAEPDTSRWIGPIPSVDTPPTDGYGQDDCDLPFSHPGGPAPKYGAYRPIHRHDAASGEWSLWRAHTSPTRMYLVESADGHPQWLVEAPADRPSARAVNIAIAAIADGVPEGEILRLGVLREELTEARAVRLASGGCGYCARYGAIAVE